VEGVCRQRTPPSHNLSEGGVGGGVSKRKHPLCLTFRVREGGGGDVSTRNPSVSQFERGRGRWWCVEEETPPPSHVSSEGGGWRGCVNQEPLRLAIRAREGLVAMHRQKRHPLRLAFRAREGVEAATRRREGPFVVLLLLVVSKLKSNR